MTQLVAIIVNNGHASPILAPTSVPEGPRDVLMLAQREAAERQWLQFFAAIKGAFR